MIQGDVYNAALERFAGEVEHIIDSRGLAKIQGNFDSRPSTTRD